MFPIILQKNRRVNFITLNFCEFNAIKCIFWRTIDAGPYISQIFTSFKDKYGNTVTMIPAAEAVFLFNLTFGRYS
ncbi:hypothetical protein CLOSTASPAR_05829 [[Clostridium] asparagiforme DSM 15981]|uniref:Uncharacterized protein n=1 Tax=[Clostridium] asparagiforme DSM 15981 TaxID=518636 RepID=C0D979_9FIRM|nr:hypothetical protein CLOSTASPAR_05829 [[Clostridium] asparagiforme DSM 15981]